MAERDWRQEAMWWAALAALWAVVAALWADDVVVRILAAVEVLAVAVSVVRAWRAGR